MTTATTTFQTVARELAGAFELATRADGSEFYRLAATAPAWIVRAEVGHAAHVAVDGADCRFPDDWIYRLAARAADWLADSGYTSADDARDDAQEFADGSPDVSIYSLFTWAAAHAPARRRGGAGLNPWKRRTNIMRTVETTVYTYDELPDDDARQRARDWYAGTGIPHDWYDYIFDDARAVGAALGFTVGDIYFSGFWSQGDGASFDADYSYSRGWRAKLKAYCPLESEAFAIGETLQAIQKRRGYRLSGRVAHDRGSRCAHENTLRASLEFSGDGRDASDDDTATFLECARDFARWIYSRLETEYEYQAHGEGAAETIRANGWEFTESGEFAR